MKFYKPLLLLFLFPLAATANWTVRGGLLFDYPSDFSGKGSTIAKTVVDSGIGYNVAVGYDLAVFRAEVEWISLKSDIGSIEGEFVSAAGDFERNTLFVNAFIDFPLFPLLDGYLGGGVGVAKATLEFEAEDDLGLLDSVGFSDGATIFGAQIMVGVRMELADRLHATIGYRYYLYQDTAVRDQAIGLSADSGQHAFDASLGFGF